MSCPRHHIGHTRAFWTTHAMPLINQMLASRAALEASHRVLPNGAARQLSLNCFFYSPSSSLSSPRKNYKILGSSTFLLLYIFF
jgi:hypothetical protein